MSTPKEFDSILREEAAMNAAWLPITNTFELGDYGLVSGGVFHKMGNISAFGVAFAEADGPASKLRFTSKGTTVTRFAAGAEVDVLPEADIEAKMTFEFEEEESFLLRAATITSKEMQSTHAVARKLLQAPGWKRKYKVVATTYHAKNCAVVSTKEAGAKLEINGKAKAVAAFDLGNVGADIGYQSNKSLGLEVMGASGVIGLRLFRLPKWFGSDPKFLDEKPDTELVEMLEGDLEDDV